MNNNNNNNKKNPITGEDKANALNKERALFLKELSKDPNIELDKLSNRLMIDPRKSLDVVKNFLVVLSECSNEGDFQRLKSLVNQGVDAYTQLDETHLSALIPLLNKYGEPSLVAKYEANKLKREQEKQQQQQAPQYQQATPYSHEAQQPQGPGPQQQGQQQQVNPSGNPNVEIIPPGGFDPRAEAQNFNPDEYNYGPSPFDQSQATTEDLNKGYDYRYLSGLNRVGLIRWAGKHVPNPKPWPQSIEDFVQYFELNQDKLMVAPEVLHRELQQHFGERTGDNMTKLINSFIKWLKPDEQFGYRKQDPRQAQQGPGGYGNPVQMGAQFEDPYNTYYHNEGVLPYGVDARSNSARRMIAEFEQERKREKEEKKKREQLFEDIRMKVQMDMTNFLDKKGGNGAGGGNTMLDTVQQMIPALLIAQVMGGKMSMEPFTDPESGKTTMRMVPSAGDNGAAAYDPDRITAKDLMDHMMNMYGLVDKKRDENTTLQGTIIQQMLDRLDKRGSLAGEMIEMHKLYKEISPQQPQLGGEKFAAQTADMARIMLEGRKFEADKERTDKLMEYQWGQKEKLAEYDFKREQSGTDLRKTMIKSISGALGSNIPTIFNLIMLLTGKNQQLPMAGMGGGSGEAQAANPMSGIMNMVGNLLGGGGGDLNKMFGGMMGGGQDEDEEEEDDDEQNYFRIPKKKKYRNRPVSQASPGFDMSDLANMFGGGGGGQQQADDSPMPNMGFGFGQGAPEETNFNQVPPAGQMRPPPVTTHRGPTDDYSGLYDELSTPTQAPTQYYQPPPQQQQQQPQATVAQPAVSPTVPLQTQDEELQVPTAEEMIPNAQPEIEEDYPIFTPDNFEEYSEEQLQMLLEKGAKAEESANSYLDSINQKLKEKNKGKEKKVKS